MKKYLSLLLVVLLSLSIFLVGCNNNSESTASETQSEEAKSNESTNEETSTEEKATTDSSEQVTITFASWAAPELIEARINAFMDLHPNIKVEHDKSITWPWDDNLAAAAAAKKLPDVMELNVVPTAVANDWIEDLTPYLENDPDYNAENIFGNLTETTNYNGKQYALPHSLFANGIFINLDLFEKENIPVPSMDWTINDFKKYATQLTKFNEHQFGAQGVGSFDAVLPAQYDPSLGWHTFDGEKYNFDNPAFVKTHKYIHDLAFKDKVSPEIYTPEEKEEWYGKDKDPWQLGKVAMSFGGTWGFTNFSENLTFNWDFRPIPAEKGQRIPLITDYIGMSKSSEHKEAAFEFVKFMTYSKEGWEKRLEVEQPLASLPLINDEDVWNTYLNSEHVPAGMKEILPMIGDGFSGTFKWLPGFDEIQNNIIGPHIPKFKTGEEKPEDFVDDFQQRATEAYDTGMEKVIEATKD